MNKTEQQENQQQGFDLSIGDEAKVGISRKEVDLDLNHKNEPLPHAARVQIIRDFAKDFSLKTTGELTEARNKAIERAKNDKELKILLQDYFQKAKGTDKKVPGFAMSDRIDDDTLKSLIPDVVYKTKFEEKNPAQKQLLAQEMLGAGYTMEMSEAQQETFLQENKMDLLIEARELYHGADNIHGIVANHETGLFEERQAKIDKELQEQTKLANRKIAYEVDDLTDEDVKVANTIQFTMDDRSDTLNEVTEVVKEEGLQALLEKEKKGEITLDNYSKAYVKGMMDDIEEHKALINDLPPEEQTILKEMINDITENGIDHAIQSAEKSIEGLDCKSTLQMEAIGNAIEEEQTFKDSLRKDIVDAMEAIEKELEDKGLANSREASKQKMNIKTEVDNIFDQVKKEGFQNTSTFEVNDKLTKLTRKYARVVNEDLSLNQSENFQKNLPDRKSVV